MFMPMNLPQPPLRDRHITFADDDNTLPSPIRTVDHRVTFQDYRRVRAKKARENRTTQFLGQAMKSSMFG